MVRSVSVRWLCGRDRSTDGSTGAAMSGLVVLMVTPDGPSLDVDRRPAAPPFDAVREDDV